MTSTTFRLGLVRPTGAETAAVPADLVRITDQLDLVTATDDQGTFASRPPVTVARRGAWYWATDAQVLMRCTGTAWVAVQALAPDLPSPPNAYVAGQLWSLRPYPTTFPDVRWTFQLRDNVWRRIDGEPLEGLADASVTMQTTRNAPTDGAIVIPVAGAYRLEIAGRLQATVGPGGLRDLVLEAYGWNTGEVYLDAVHTVTAASGSSVTRSRVVNLSANTELRIANRINGGPATAAVSNAALRVLPIRLTG